MNCTPQELSRLTLQQQRQINDLRSRIAGLEGVDTDNFNAVLPLDGEGSLSDPLRISTDGANEGDSLTLHEGEWKARPGVAHSHANKPLLDSIETPGNLALHVDNTKLLLTRIDGTIAEVDIPVQGGGGGGAPAQVNADERGKTLPNATNSLRSFSPKDVLEIVELRNGIRAVRNYTEFAEALADPAIPLIKVDGRIDLPSTVTISRSVAIVGYNRYTDGFRITSNSDVFILAANRIYLSEICLQGPSATQGRALTIDRSSQRSGLRVSNCWIHDIGRGIWSQGAAGHVEMLIQGNIFENLDESIGYINTASFEGCAVFFQGNHNVRVLDNVMKNLSGNGIWVGAAGSETTILRNDIRDSARTPIEVFFGDETRISDNFCKDAVTIGISCACRQSTVTGNTIINVGDIGIELFAHGESSSVVCTNNRINQVNYGQFSIPSPCQGIGVEHYDDTCSCNVTGNIIAQIAPNGGKFFGVQTQTSTGVRIDGNIIRGLAQVYADAVAVVINNGSQACVVTNNSFFGDIGFVILYSGNNHVVRNNIGYPRGGPGGFSNFSAGDQYVNDLGPWNNIGTFAGDNLQLS